MLLGCIGVHNQLDTKPLLYACFFRSVYIYIYLPSIETNPEQLPVNQPKPAVRSATISDSANWQMEENV